MSEAYWQAKIWGLLHDPAVKALHNNSGRGGNSFWQQLEVMQDWVENKWNPEESHRTILEHIHLADYISSASDRGAIGSVTESINYAPGNNRDEGLEIRHLLSGAKLNFKIKQHQELLANRKQYLEDKEQKLLQTIPETVKTNPETLFWWLWRCLPKATCDEFQDPSLMLMPAETRLPDSSIWSHASLTAALAGALAGYDLTQGDLQSNWSSTKTLSHPYLASFTFTPVQELIKASRKMRDFWTGSWILHYLSAKVCWKLALQYGPDTLLYPSLFQQPLIDYWLLQKFPEFKSWVKQPGDRALLTAGFPNVLVLLLPKAKVQAAMQTAQQTLLEEWQKIGKLVFDDLKRRNWMPDLQADSHTWRNWLKAQWQFYWAAVPIGKEGEPLKNAAIPQDRQDEFNPWLNAQNQAYNLYKNKQKLFLDAEINFLREAYQHRFEKHGRRFSVNIGSWWPHIFDQTRYALAAAKNARTWQIPTAFGPRSTVSGLGSVVHPGKDWITEAETKKYWERQAGLFDGREQLNATEVVKRGLEKVLPELLNLKINDIASYPDLTTGVAGYLKVSDRTHLEYFHNVCRLVSQQLLTTEKVLPDLTQKWGVPWIDDHQDSEFRRYHPRLLNAGWLVEDLETREVLDIQKRIKNTKLQIEEAGTLNQRHQTLEKLQADLTDITIQYRSTIQGVLDRYYPNNNPADWYVLAAGDGDGMSEWLKGMKLKPYREYIPSGLKASSPKFQEFLNLQKRMGPSTHNALSRALLDFSNQLVPYLTQQRYAGRLIYGGGDDVLAYINLWEWDKWLWDIRECFRGDKDPGNEFKNEGDYWQWNKAEAPVIDRPLFTMGQEATISFGIAIAHHSVPLAITLENLWEAEKQAKEHVYLEAGKKQQKDAVQVRVLYGNGNTLKATAKFKVFHQWQQLIHVTEDGAIFEQAAQIWNQHPAPIIDAIPAWTTAFCDRRDRFQGEETAKNQFQQYLTEFLKALWLATPETDLTSEVQNWLKLAAFVLRQRRIEI